MKFITVCVFLALAVSVRSSKEMLMKLMTECKASVGATDEDLAKMMMHAPADNQQQKCLFNCIMSNVGVVRTKEHQLHKSIKNIIFRSREVNL